MSYFQNLTTENTEKFSTFEEILLESTEDFSATSVVSYSLLFFIKILTIPGAVLNFMLWQKDL